MFPNKTNYTKWVALKRRFMFFAEDTGKVQFFSPRHGRMRTDRLGPTNELRQGCTVCHIEMRWFEVKNEVLTERRSFAAIFSQISIFRVCTLLLLNLIGPFNKNLYSTFNEAIFTPMR